MNDSLQGPALDSLAQSWLGERSDHWWVSTRRDRPFVPAAAWRNATTLTTSRRTLRATFTPRSIEAPWAQNSLTLKSHYQSQRERLDPVSGISPGAGQKMRRYFRWFVSLKFDPVPPSRTRGVFASIQST